tara:strand:+ start:4086 stop:5456 length:1371 start_codon:yes stop_codon:yes gene_type:complete
MKSLATTARYRLISDNEMPAIPDNWSLERFRFLFSESKERNGEEPVGDMLSVSEYRGVVPRDYENEQQRRSDDELTTYRVVRPGQLAVNTMWLNHLGLGVSDHLGHVSPAYAVYEISPRLNGRFAHHLLRSQFYLKIYLRYLYGIRPNSHQIKTDDWNSIPIIVPPLDSQKEIADFLDRETARIDQLVEKKSGLVRIQQQLRASACLECLVGGSEGFKWDPVAQSYAFQLPSSEWRVNRVKHIVSFMTSGSRGWGDIIRDDGEVFLQSGNIGRDMDVDFDNVERVEPQSGTEARRTSVRSSDTLVCITGGRTGAVGFVSILPETSYINQHVCLLRPDSSKIDPKLLAQMLWSEIGQAQFSSTQYGLKQGLGFAEVANVRLPIPPRDSQSSIVADIERRTKRIDDLTRLIKKSIDVLTERRAALITAAVTGQIDTTEYARRGDNDRRLDAIEAEMRA